MKEYQKIHEIYEKSAEQLRNSCEEFLSSEVKKNGGEIVFDEDSDIYVSYDGGNHVEYASTLMNRVFGIFEKKGEIYLDTEESEEYEISRLSTDELFDLCYAIDED